MRGAHPLTIHVTLLIEAVLVLLPAASQAQVQTMPARVCAEPVPIAGASPRAGGPIGAGSLIDDLTTLYNGGRRDELRARIQELIARIRAAYPDGCAPADHAATPSDHGAMTDDSGAMLAGAGTHAQAPASWLDTARHHVAVSWVATDPRAGRSMLARVLLHGAGTRATLEYADANLPGVGAAPGGPQLVELFLARSRDAVMSALYTSTRERDPAASQPAAFAQALAGPMFAAIGAIAGDVAARPAPPPPEADLWATIAVAALPHARAAVRLRATARDGAAASADLTFHNRPLSRWSFGAGAAVIAAASVPTPRVDLDSGGVIVADPLPRVMAMAHVNWSPRGYDGDAPAVSGAERVRLFAGAALTPDFGITGGVTVLVVRGVGVSTGVAFLFAKGTGAEAIGRVPANPSRPFRLAVPAAWFIGLTFNPK